MSAPPAIRATFSEWRMVKTRKVLALIFEVPLEQQADVLTILGAPMPDAEIWCGIARLDLSAKPPDEQHDPGGITWVDENLQPIPSRAKAAYAQATPGEQAVTRAALLAEDPKFRTWAAGGEPEPLSEIDAAQFIRDNCCDGGSRKLIAEDPECLARFLALEVDYKIFSGQMPEPR